MARPRRDDQEVLIDRIAATLSSRQQLEPWTLAEIAPSVGLSPAGLIKRFGSRSGILQALSHRWLAAIPEPRSDDPADRPAAEEIRTWVEGRFAAGGPHAIAYGLVNLVDDLLDESLRGLLAEGWEKEIRYLAGLLARLDLPGLRDPNAGAALLFDTLHGGMLRAAASTDPHHPTETLDQLLEAWT